MALRRIVRIVIVRNKIKSTNGINHSKHRTYNNVNNITYVRRTRTTVVTSWDTFLYGRECCTYNTNNINIIQPNKNRRENNQLTSEVLTPVYAVRFDL